MKRIYKGPMRNLVVTNLDIKDNMITLLEYDTPIVKKDMLFYRNKFGALISFDFDTRLPDFGEAADWVKDSVKGRGHLEPPYPTCSFVDEDDVSFSHEMDNKSFKLLRKQYRNAKKKK